MAKSADAADGEVRKSAASANEESVGEAINNATGGRTTEVNASGYAMAHVDSKIRGSQGGTSIACDIDCDTGRNQKDEDRQRDTGQRLGGLWKECMG